MKRLFVALVLSAAALISQTTQAEVLSLPSITVVALVKVKPGTEQEFKQAAAQILAPTRSEAGNISYVFVQSIKDPTSFATTEIWASQAALDQHMASAHMQEFFGIVGSFFEPGFPVINEYQAFEK